MKVAEKIEKRIEKMQDGTTFKYQELTIAPEAISSRNDSRLEFRWQNN